MEYVCKHLRQSLIVENYNTQIGQRGGNQPSKDQGGKQGGGNKGGQQGGQSGKQGGSNR
jgi:hypothetical protein